MVFRSEMFRKATIIGVGLIGGSIGLAMKKNKIAREVVGVSQKNQSLNFAVKNNVVDSGTQDLKKGVAGADLVVLAAPVGTIVKVLTEIGPHLKRNCIVTDVGSTKTTIVDVALKHLPNPGFFIGSHPLAGSDKTGVMNANADLFNGSLCVLTPTNKTNRLARDKVKHFWTKVGSKVKVLTPAEHDRILTYISHLPHLMAYSLMDTIPQEFLPYAAQGLKDTTRIASSSPQIWNDISLANAKNIVDSMDEFVTVFNNLRKAIVDRDEKELTDQFLRSKNKRDSLEKK